MDQIEKVARVIAGHTGPLFEDLPKDHAEYMKIRYTSDHISDETQESMLDVAKAVMEVIEE